jgi:hypothetical protein
VSGQVKRRNKTVNKMFAGKISVEEARRRAGGKFARKAAAPSVTKARQAPATPGIDGALARLAEQAAEDPRQALKAMRAQAAVPPAVVPLTPGGLPVQRLGQLPLGRALEDPGDLGEQVGAPGGQVPQLGHRGIVLGLGEVPPPGVALRCAHELCGEDAVSFRRIIEHAF